MKLSIKKQTNRREPTVEVEIVPHTAATPVKFELSETAWKSLAAMIDAGFRASTFAISLDI